MRASRLVSLLLLLQTRGRMTAQTLADELEVSVRTVYRDVESLGSAGVPIYADRGPAGGYQLLDGYRTRLTGLTSDEAGTLFLAGMPGPAAELGLGSVLAAAELKLRASLPGELADRADRVRERFHLDAPGWFRGDEPTPHLSTVADAVWSSRVLTVRYRRWKAPREVTRRLHPLGVVLKAGRWYLVATAETRTTAYRVSNILEAEVLDEPAVRPAGFDLAEFWRQWTEQYEHSVYTATATVRMTAAALDRMAFIFPPEMSRVARASAGTPDETGWVTTTVPIESLRHGHMELLKLGAEAEVLAPAELRELFGATATGLRRIYEPEEVAAAAQPSPVLPLGSVGLPPPVPPVSPPDGGGAGGTVVGSPVGFSPLDGLGPTVVTLGEGEEVPLPRLGRVDTLRVGDGASLGSSEARPDGVADGVAVTGSRLTRGVVRSGESPAPAEASAPAPEPPISC